MYAPEAFAYDLFVSYSSTDQQFAERLRDELLSRAKVLRSRMRVFVPHLAPFSADHQQIVQEALLRSRFLLLVASPEATRSTWVQREINAWWEYHRGRDVLIALVRGEPESAIPNLLIEPYGSIPLYLDFRASATPATSPGDPSLHDELVDVLAAIVLQVERSLVSQERRRRRKHSLVDRVQEWTSLLSKRDPVYLGVSAPVAVRPGDEFTARLVAYVPSMEDAVREQITELSPRSASRLRLRRCMWQRGTRVRVRLSASLLHISPHQVEFTWEGRASFAEFDVRVPPDAAEIDTVLRFEVLIGGIVIACIRADLRIRKDAAQRKTNVVSGRPIRSAFASYAAEDRLRVLDRVAEVRRNGVRVFLDCLSLHPGERWKRRLKKEIQAREGFFLFWSVAARSSEWVDWEWRTRLRSKGLDGIALHPLDPEHRAPPPIELRSLHFNDPLMLIREGFDSGRRNHETQDEGERLP